MQSPYEVAELVAFLLGEATANFRPAHIEMNVAYCGGGFGGRDHTPFPLYVALATIAFPDRPVRLANSRFDQFQSGIKRHAFNIKTRIGSTGQQARSWDSLLTTRRTAAASPIFQPMWRRSPRTRRLAPTMPRKATSQR